MESTRLVTLSLGTRTLPLPVYFPSISSVKTALRPTEYLRLLSSLTNLNSQFLISAFDLATAENPEASEILLCAANNSGAIILMDSGNYESFWKDAKATWTQEAFHDVLRTFSCDITFAFDEQEPPAKAEEHTALIVSRLRDEPECIWQSHSNPNHSRHSGAVA